MHLIKLTNVLLFLLILCYFITSSYFYNLISKCTRNPTQSSFVSENVSNNFGQILETFPWKLFNTSGFSKNLTNHYIITEKLISQLIPFVTMEPLVPINEDCKPPPFKKLNCSSSNILRKPRRIAVLLQFGFDVDNLEIHLNELYDIVDRFFILESYRSHFRALMKPLVWEVVKEQNRFKKFLPKITHLVLDDSDMVQVVNDLDLERNGNTNGPITSDDEQYYGIETLHEKIRWEKFLSWNNYTRYFRDDDLVGFGDADEIPSRDAINYLKNCDFTIDPVDIGIWFPFGNIKQAFQTDYPVSPKHVFTLGDPTYWKLKTSKSKSRQMNSDPYPSRNRGYSPNFILGGMHMSHYGYLPYQITKRITQTEQSLEDFYFVTKLLEDHLNTISKSSLRELEKFFAKIPESRKKKIYDLKELKKYPMFHMDEIAVLPWYYDCNRLRYPSWEGGHDTRLD